MVKRHCVLALLLVLVGAMPFISCGTTDTVTGAVSMSETNAPRIITVLQDEFWGNTAGAVALIESFASELNLDIEIERVIVRTDAEVQKFRFPGSPTVRINGLDIQPSARAGTQYGFAWRLTDWTQGASATQTMLFNAFKEAGWVSGEPPFASKGLIEGLRIK